MAGKDVSSKAELDEILRSSPGAVVIHFWASWCEASGHMDELIKHLSADFPHAIFLRVEAEEQPEISEAYAVAAVPFFAFCKEGKTVDTLEGANPSALADKIAKLAGSANAVKAAAPASLGMAAGPAVIEKIQDMASQNGSSTEKEKLSDALQTRLMQLVNSEPVFLFMKGSPEQPRCKFSRKVVEVLKEEGVEYGSFDILSDDEVRAGLKLFSNWPTFPQLFCKGNLIGGCDIAVAMHESGELKDVFIENGVALHPPVKVADPESKPAVAIHPPVKIAEAENAPVSGLDALSDALKSRLQSLINSSTVMVFVKGTPEHPKCGFSGKVMEILKQGKVPFKTFDILSDDEVRQGLKVYSQWPSYPQLYVGGELIGGSDVVMEMNKTGELVDILSKNGITWGASLEDRLRSLISSSEVMLFMKGTPDVPRCGFSSKVANALKQEGIDFGYFDILTDEEVRNGLKTFSNWPTYPQLYYKGELIGGCDIVLDLQMNGELRSTLSE